jgi:hydroxyethylthiazole kinase-like uncharacterized protein yjeF
MENTSQPILTSTEISGVEAACVRRGVTDLMQRAGLAAARAAQSMLGDTAKSVLVLAGPGNNGGDAFEVACHLKQWFYRVTVFFSGDANKLPPDARAAHAKWMAHSGATVSVMPPGSFDLVVDGLFGIGLKRAPKGIYAGVIEAANQMSARLGKPILALDVPSGLDADTGTIPAPSAASGVRVPATAIRATRTVTFIALKPGLLTLAGPEHCGEIELAGLDLDGTLLGKASGRTIGCDLFAGRLTARRKNAHKGDMGAVGIVGGANGMTGAALLAGRAALKLGAGRVYCGLLADSAPVFDPCQLELMLRPAAGIIDPELVNALVLGPGLGQSPGARALVERALSSPMPLVLDADALNLIAAKPALATALSKRDAFSILTPHPGEASRLLGISIAEIQADRIAAAEELALHFCCPALLKGAGSVVAPDVSHWFINTTGNPGMASAGMGDVLAGLIGTLLAQGWDARDALLAGVHLHASAADACVARGIGPAGLTASEVTDAARTLFNQWCGT